MNLLTKIRNIGFQIDLDNGDLLIEPGDKLSANQLVFLKSHKAVIIQELIQEQSVNCANSSISKNDEQTILSWLRFIGETNKENIEDVLRQCQTEPDALEYFLKRSIEIPVTSDLDDRRYCRECQHLINGQCIVQRFRPVDTHPRRCIDFYGIE